MKARILILISLLALLLVSTAVLADGRPTGIRIGRVANISASGVEIDVTVPGTGSLYTAPTANWSGNTSVWLGNSLGNAYNFYGYPVWQYRSPSFSVPLPWAIDWGDGYRTTSTVVFGPPGGPFVGTFSHTYVPGGMPYSYTITVGDALCCSSRVIPGANKGTGVTTGNTITGTLRFVRTFGYLYAYNLTFTEVRYAEQAVTNTATATTGQGIPTLNVYGLLAMALVLVGVGILVYREPQRFAA